MTAPQFVSIGHVTFDVTPDDLSRREPGGAVAFASITASRHGIEPAIVTSCANDYPMDVVIDNPDRYVRVDSSYTSTFENRYDANGDRVQVLHHRADDIIPDQIPLEWREPEMLFVGPLTQEMAVDCLDWFRPRVSCVVPQGWLRSWDEVLPSEIAVSKSPPRGMSRGWDICVISESESNRSTLDEWRGTADHLVVTKGSNGADLYSVGKIGATPVPSFSQQVEGAGTDTTGAGDVFAAAMLIRYASTKDARRAADYASLCAALSTRAPSWSAVEEPSEALIALVKGLGETAGIDPSPA